MKNEIYNLSLNNLDKKIPDNYDDQIIPAIEAATLNIPGDVIKGKIYNYVIYYYNKGILEGILPSIYIYTQNGNKRVSYKITNRSITIKLINE